ncbi:MAG: NAD-dependent deacylase [Phycisphaerae bacterium]|nr:NAD-dependent deacylase [Phycisphaerae bacterium]
MMRESTIQTIADACLTARHVVVVTGAGLSAESGLSTFRGPREALWSRYDPMRLATPEAFEQDPALVTRWYDWRRQAGLQARPNAGHLALVCLERIVTASGVGFTLLTQNVDRLHHRAGSVNVYELHGSIHEWRCTVTGQSFEPPPQPFQEFPPRSPFDPRGRLRPAVVWFGEPLPAEVLRVAAEAMESCDVFFSIGTSSVVYPAAGFAEQVIARGGLTIEVNPNETPISGRVNHAARESSGSWLPRLIAHISL